MGAVGAVLLLLVAGAVGRLTRRCTEVWHPHYHATLAMSPWGTQTPVGTHLARPLPSPLLAGSKKTTTTTIVGEPGGGAQAGSCPRHRSGQFAGTKPKSSPHLDLRWQMAPPGTTLPFTLPHLAPLPRYAASHPGTSLYIPVPTRIHPTPPHPIA